MKLYDLGALILVALLLYGLVQAGIEEGEDSCNIHKTPTVSMKQVIEQ